jgi:hypothetical protein
MIKLKTLLAESLRSEDSNHVLYWILKHASNIAIKLGEQIDKELGGGANGVAFLLKSGKVLKITGDDQEVAAASRYRTKQNVPHIVSVYDVRKLEGDIVNPEDPNYEKFKTSWDRGRQFYVIIMDAVTPFSKNEQEVWDLIGQDYLNSSFNDENTEDKLLHTLEENPYLRLPEGWIDKLITQRQSVLAAFKRNSVYAREAHSENMGWNRQGQLVHFDWWMSVESDFFGNTRFEKKPRRLNKPVQYDASGIDTPNDPTM